MATTAVQRYGTITAEQAYSSMAFLKTRYHGNVGMLVIPPQDRFKRRHYLDLWKACEQAPPLRRSYPCKIVEGGFAWDADDASVALCRRLFLEQRTKRRGVRSRPEQRIQFKGANGPYFPDRWEQCWDTWQGHFDDELWVRYAPRDSILVAGKYGVSGERMLAFGHVLHACGWSIELPSRVDTPATYIVGPFPDP
ncbi:Uncharacterized protein PBTT_00066 [Plasmodiophora brassicae]